MTDFVTDTHALIWYLQDSPRLSSAAQTAFDACDKGEAIIYIPTICLVEIIYLQEKGRIPPDLLTQFEAELQAGEIGLVIVDLTDEVAKAIKGVPRTKVPDMPDRIIAATALHLEIPLLSRDRKIRFSTVKTVW
ncbi:MAG: type II toxin-antitoxin system VapC family toxin [Deltaproteobacteria bacterium]|nr:type II toxin-antitoxin system VapC family toxin [Deltaproteobacteria bacterium]